MKPKEPKGSRSVANRWTPVLAKAGWTPVSDYFLENYHRLTPPIKNNEAMLIIHLMAYKWDESAPYPGFKTLAKKMGISPEAARLHARNLESNGYLRREMQVGETNKFHLDKLFSALELLMAEDALESAQQKHKPDRRQVVHQRPRNVSLSPRPISTPH